MHADDFDDSVRASMGIAQYSSTAKRFREKTFFTDSLSINPKKETTMPSGNDIQVTDASFYHEDEDEWGGKTALGNTLHYSDDPEIPTSCATNWGKFPPGTLLRVNGKKYIVEDYGSFVNDYPDRVDRYVPKNKYTNELAKNPSVEVLKWGDFGLAVDMLRTRNPQDHPHIAMMLQQAEARW